MIIYKDLKYSFVEFFNEENGILIRSNVMDDNCETDTTANCRSFPELIDVGIMGTCLASKKGFCLASGVDCYQSAPLQKRKNMSLEMYTDILRQCTGKTFQVALGGAGDPNKHECFEEILKSTRQYHIVPNMTTSGYMLSDREIDLIKNYCGAVAVSYYSRLDSEGNETNPMTLSAVSRLVEAGCTTNIHFVVSKENIKEAIYRIENNIFPDGINAVIFLLYKPVGLASQNKVLSFDDPDYIKFINLISIENKKYKFGLDSCQSPALATINTNISKESIEFCDAARFSMYIDCDMIAYPCSFAHEKNELSVDLKKYTIEDAWNSSIFSKFRDKHINQCSYCRIQECRNCPLDLGINLCGKFREQINE